MFDFKLDRDSKLVRAAVGGFWNEHEAKLFASAFQSHARQARDLWGVVRMLIDARESPVQSPEVMKALVGLNQSLIEVPGDRIAVIVATSLVKMQAHRVMSDEFERGSDVGGLFLSPNAAETWLCAHA